MKAWQGSGLAIGLASDAGTVASPIAQVNATVLPIIITYARLCISLQSHGRPASHTTPCGWELTRSQAESGGEKGVMVFWRLRRRPWRAPDGAPRVDCRGQAAIRARSRGLAARARGRRTSRGSAPWS